MNDKYLPIKIVLQKTTDTQKNSGRGSTKFFGKLTQDIKDDLINKFENILDYYQDVFIESELIPAVAKIKVKPEAIAKSHKPNDLCKACTIIGSEDLEEIYIKVTPKTVRDTISSIKNPTSEKFKANLTVITDIKPITNEDKIAESLSLIDKQGCFDEIKDKIKIKVFDFGDEFDNNQIFGYVMKKLNDFGFAESHSLISYGDHIKFIKLEVSSYEDINKIASINGVKAVDFFQEYSLPLNEYANANLYELLDNEQNEESEIRIGIIDGGISDDNVFLRSHIVAREEYVNEAYRDPRHATFIASTIFYGNKLNNLSSEISKFKLIDIIAMPNGDVKYGPTDTLNEEELYEIIEEVMQKYASSVKIWNLSLGIPGKVCNGSMSDLGVFLDYIQDKYAVQIFVSSGNLTNLPLREWPPQAGIGERDRLISPADSVRAITVGSLALYESNNSIVKSNQPSPFSLRGPGANYIIKPDVVDYGGNLSKNFDMTSLAMKGLDPSGSIIEGNGTSYANPRIVQKFATIVDEMVEKDLLLAKAMLIHSARMESRELLDKNKEFIKYYGFGMPSINPRGVLQCTENEITLVFKQKVTQGTHLEMYDFPYPTSLIKNGKCHGEICMTLAYNPLLDDRFGREYCRTNIDVGFGTYKHNPKDGELKYSSCVPLERKWDDKYERARVEDGFKWSPIKSYYRKISNKGINIGEGWKVRIDLTPRNGVTALVQEFVLIITIKAPEGQDIYSEVVNGLRLRGYITNNLETRQQIRQQNI